MSILEDYDHDSAEIRELESDISKLCDTLSAFEQHGVSKSAVKLLCLSNLLDSTSRLALETLLVTEEFATEAVDAKQSILDTIKNKTAQWSAKILTFFKESGSKFLTRVENLWTAFKSKLPEAKAKLVEVANDSTAYVKAHPYRTVAAAVAASVAVLGIIAFAGRMLPTVTNSKAMVTFTNSLTKQINGVKWPFGEVTANVVAGGKKVAIGVTAVGAVAGVAKLAQLGWSKVTAEQLDRSLEVVCNSVETTWNALAPKVASVSRTALDFTKATLTAATTGFKEGYGAFVNERELPPTISETSILKEGVYVAMGGIVATSSVLLFWASSILYGLYKLASKIIGGTISLCAQTIGALSHPTHKEYV